MKKFPGILVAFFLISVMALLCGCGGKFQPGRRGKPSPSPTASPSPKNDSYENKTVGYRFSIPPDWVAPNPEFAGDIYLEYGEAPFSPVPSFNSQSEKVKGVSSADLHDPKYQRTLKDEIEPGLKAAEENNIKMGSVPAYQIVYGVDQGDNSIIIHQTYVYHNGYLIVFTGGCREDKYLEFESVFDGFIESVVLD
ncbi:MAG: PsbP-related protein [Candidatus Eremiobacteraeota bacterium]|nr:PsbP-related protein [Candidatus Eremiobacteraeota bacterium]